MATTWTNTPVISQIKLPGSAGTYYVKDAEAREKIEKLEGVTGALLWKGVTTTTLEDGKNTSPIIIREKSVAPVVGDVVLYGKKEFVYDGSVWQELGDLADLTQLLGELGAFAKANTGTFNANTITISGGEFKPSQTDVDITTETSENGNYTPAGTVTVTTKTTENKSAAVTVETGGTVTYTPAGKVGTPTISVDTAGSTTTVNSITSVGTLPSWSAEMGTGEGNTETLIFNWNEGTLPTKSADTTVKTGDASYKSTEPSFTGTGVALKTADIVVPSTFEGSFSGTKVNITGTNTAAGTFTQPSASGTITVNPVPKSS